ncbi:hypothetical protein AHiyo8_43830 [Arthrobacter sp. Hiyo8]|nr:hypothetical protein AHiyo8_43830 [Arthrobacter sp. Hiyo8]
MLGGGEQPARRVLMRENRDDAGYLKGRRRIDGDNPGMRMWRAQQLQVQQAWELFRRDVEGVAGGAGDDGAPRRAGTLSPS